VANRVTDVCSKSVIHGIISEISSSEEDISVFALVIIKCFDFNKRGCFLEFRISLSSLSSPSPLPPNIPNDEEDH